METIRHSDSIVIGRPATQLYDMISDVTRMGEWSPICKAGWWDDGDSARVGAHFTGRNELPDRTWETRSEVVAADRPREFAFVVEATGTRWAYTFAPVEGGTQVTESWEFPPEASAAFEQRFGDDAPAQIAERRRLAETGMRATLMAIKESAETG